MISDYKIAKQRLLTHSDIDCQQFFMTRGCGVEYGYSLLINDDISGAEKVFKEYSDTDLRAKWALIMLSMINGNISEYPTYLELRNFLEIDINILIHYYKGDYVEKIIRYSDFLFTINPEVYKFIGRVFYNNDLLEQSMYFLKRAKSYFYNDPELHYLLAYIFYNNKDYVNAKKAIDDCLQILPDYFPASNMKKLLK